MDEQRPLSVTELNRAARRLLEEAIGDVWVRGEISEASHAPSGHVYFTLRDEEAEINAVRFRGRAPLLVTLTPGMAVLVYGRLTVYEPRGRYQFVATLVQPIGAGPLQAAFEVLKEKLRVEGLFDPAHKKALPPFPERVAVVTSPSGAALRDILAALARRWPLSHVLVFAAAVQGETAPAEIVAAIEQAVGYSESVAAIDVLLVGRGGGSAEDLAAFSDEAVARAIYACPIPVVSAVGHEVDVSIADFVADVRAPTPSTAVELATPNAADVVRQVRQGARRLRVAVDDRLRESLTALKAASRVALFREPMRRLETCEQRMDGAVLRATRATSFALDARDARLSHALDVLRLSDPRRPLARGYSITMREGSETPLRDASTVAIGERLRTLLAQGEVVSSVEDVRR
ncbi:MAG: exodeoxyribonuclease VII large subunit [Candidatus Bipolaricaulota bacterium]